MTVYFFGYVNLNKDRVEYVSFVADSPEEAEAKFDAEHGYNCEVIDSWVEEWAEEYEENLDGTEYTKHIPDCMPDSWE